MQSTEPGSTSTTTARNTETRSAPGPQASPTPAPAASTSTSAGNPPWPRPIFQQLSTSAKYIYQRNDYIKRFFWEWVQRILIRYSPRRAHGWRRFWLRKFGATIPSTCGTKATTFVMYPWLLTMGEHSWLADRVSIINPGPVNIGSHTIVSQDSYIISGSHDYRKPNLPAIFTTINIGSGVWICAGAFVGPNVTIGDNCVIGARAVLMSSVAPNMIAAGNPAKAIKPRAMEWEEGPVG